MPQPDVTVENLRLKSISHYTTGNIFKLPSLLVIDFFDTYKEELKFKFKISGDLAKPTFELEIIKQKVSKMIGESIIRSIAESPRLINKFGDKLFDVLKKPVKQFIKGLKND